MYKLIISRMDIENVPCDCAALMDQEKLTEFSFRPVGAEGILNNIYVGQVERIVKNINAAFVRISRDAVCYFDLKNQENVIYAGPKKSGPLSAGDQILVQVCREAMKGKLPAVTSNLSFAGRCLVLTAGKTGLGLSSRLSPPERERLRGILKPCVSDTYGLIARTNAENVSAKELLRELDLLKNEYAHILQYGTGRTCFSLLRKGDSFCMEILRNVYYRDLGGIVTDIPEYDPLIREYLARCYQAEEELYHFYEDPLLPLIELYGLEHKFRGICQERVWLKSGGFLVIQQTEAFVSIDVNSGKYTDKKTAADTSRKINLEAAEEIARQLRLRNLSGIILIDFINMKDEDAVRDLLVFLRSCVSRDPIKTTVHDITALNIVEVTRAKIKKPLWEELLDLKNVL